MKSFIYKIKNQNINYEEKVALITGITGQMVLTWRNFLKKKYTVHSNKGRHRLYRKN